MATVEPVPPPAPQAMEEPTDTDIAQCRSISASQVDRGLSHRARAGTARLTAGERATHAILRWRLTHCYIAYTVVFTILVMLPLGAQLIYIASTGWTFRDWQHQEWEEILEVIIGLALVAETGLSLTVLGWRGFLASYYCLFDLVVTLLGVVSMGYSLYLLGWAAQYGDLAKYKAFNVPFEFLRLVLRPARVLLVVVGMWRVWKLQVDVEELQINFEQDHGIDPSQSVVLPPAGTYQDFQQKPAEDTARQNRRPSPPPTANGHAASGQPTNHIELREGRDWNHSQDSLL